MTNTPSSEPRVPNDPVNHPSHYTQYPVEVIELTRHMSFNRGNAVKYVARAGFKGGPDKEIEDVEKAIWYLQDELTQLKKKKAEREAVILPGKLDSETLVSNAIHATSFVVNNSNDPVQIAKSVERATDYYRKAQ